MSNLNTTVIVEVTGHGTYTLGKGGARTDSIWKPHVTDIAGSVLDRTGTLAAVTAATIYDGSTDIPATALQFFFWMDQPYQIQFLSAATEVTFTGAANIPTMIGADTTVGEIGLLASATTTNISAEATLATLDEVTIWNLAAATTANWHMLVIL